MKKNRYWGLVAAVLMLTACQEGKKTGTTTSEQKTGTIVVKAQTATLTLKYPATLRGEQDIAIIRR